MDTNNGVRNNNETKEKATWIQIMVSINVTAIGLLIASNNFLKLLTYMYLLRSRLYN